MPQELKILSVLRCSAVHMAARYNQHHDDQLYKPQDAVLFWSVTPSVLTAQRASCNPEPPIESKLQYEVTETLKDTGVHVTVQCHSFYIEAAI